MKKSIVKSLSVFLALVLILSVLPMAAFAAETEHTHTFRKTEARYAYQYLDNSYHEYVCYNKYECVCGEDSFSICEIIDEQVPHLPKAGSRVYQNSYIDASGNTVETYRYTCRDCGSYYYMTVII